MIPCTFQIDLLANMIKLPHVTVVPLGPNVGPNSVGAQRPGDLHQNSAAYSFNFNQQALQLEQGLIGRDVTGQVFVRRRSSITARARIHLFALPPPRHHSLFPYPATRPRLRAPIRL